MGLIGKVCLDSGQTFSVSNESIRNQPEY